MTFDTADTSCSTLPHRLIQEDETGEEVDAGVGDGVRVEVDDVVDACPWLRDEVWGAHSLSEASLSASLLLS